MRTKRAEPAAAGDADALAFVACGRPLSGHAVRVVDAGGRELPEREEGRLEFKGPSATRGYYRNAAATRLLYDGDWLDSGDYAYLAGGEVHLTGRAKDVIIRGGRNVYPYALEQAVGGLAGVRRGCVAVFGAPEAGSGTERIIVVAETRESDAARRAALEQKINETALAVIGMPADEVVLAPPHTVPKTSSGKIRRFASREYYEHGTVPGRPPPGWWQIVRLSARSAWPQLQRHGRAALVTARGAYMLACFVLLAAPTWTLVAAMQRPRLARPFIGFMARLFFRFAALPLRADGFAHIPPGASILTLNHTSYLDAVALCAQLGGSRPYRFAAKREFAAHWFPRWFFSGIGSAFVDRVDPRRGARDVEQFQAALERGETVIFFPEGGFDRQAGLKPFRSGAFALAARTGRPVVPMAIRGARAVLRGGDWLPRPGAIRIVAAAPQRAAGSDWEATIELRDRVRAVILRLCGEADLMA
jgi:1-acyl-sn-glycerol-3-phosphate acyltransferase